MRRWFLVFFLVIPLSAVAMVPDDIFTMKSISVAGLSPDGRYLLYTIGIWDKEKGRELTSLYRLDLDTENHLKIFTPEDKSFGTVWRPDGKLIVYLRSVDDGVEVWSMDPDGANRQRLSQNTGNFGALSWSPDGKLLAWIAQDLTVDKSPGVEGLYIVAEGLAPGETVPTVLSIHGGPQWMYGGYFLPEFHILPTHHYGVIIANPTGSMGYGYDFMADIRCDWIGRPATELMACVDFAIEQGWADKDHLAVMGGSYGGHLAAALTTQTDRFGAAAVDRMYPELISFWGTTDEKWFPEWEFKGKPWEPGAKEVYLRNSPFEKVDRVKTPTLISQGHRDYRCLAAGGQIWFSALQSMGVPSRFVRFENEGHGIHQKENQVSYQEILLEWFETHLLDESGDFDEKH